MTLAMGMLRHLAGRVLFDVLTGWPLRIAPILAAASGSSATPDPCGDIVVVNWQARV